MNSIPPTSRSYALLIHPVSVGQVLHRDRARHRRRTVRPDLRERKVYREGCFTDDQASSRSRGLSTRQKCRTQRYSVSMPLTHDEQRILLVLQISSPRISCTRRKNRILTLSWRILVSQKCWIPKTRSSPLWRAPLDMPLRKSC